MTIDPTNLGATATLTFADEFNSLSLWNGTSGTWATTYLFADPNGNGSSLPTNAEQQWYINSMYGPTASIKPWTADNGILTLTAQPTDPSVAGLLGYNSPGLPAMGSYQYTSGLITSAHSFSQTYGYFEMNAQLPAGQGLWPAFWLLPSNGAWPPELDVMEVLGNNMTTLYTSSHTAETGVHTSKGLATTVADMSAGYHTYGIDWEANTVTWYFDHKAVYQIATPADMHSPMYMLANLAVGGGWPGNADATTPFPAQMKIDYIRAYQSLPDGVAPAPTPSPAPTPTPTPAPTPTPIASDAPQTLTGGAADDLLMGGAGNDSISGGGGNDTINGKMGDDVISGGDGHDWLYGGKGNDYLIGQQGNDVLIGNLGNDVLVGGQGDDTLYGGQGDDVLKGDNGNDWLSGDRGNDTLTGGFGADTFHFSPHSGADVVTDFTQQQGDRIQIDPGMTYTLSQVGADTVIDFGSGDHVVLQQVQMNSLTPGWIFA